MKSWVRLWISALLVLTIAGCGQPLALFRPHVEIVARTHPQSLSGSTSRVDFALTGISGGVKGKGTWAVNARTKVVTVTLDVQGLAIARMYAADVFHGTCGHIGEPLFALRPLVAGATGRADSTTVIRGVKVLPGPAENVGVEVRQNNSATAAPLACGTIGPSTGPG